MPNMGDKSSSPMALGSSKIATEIACSVHSQVLLAAAAAVAPAVSAILTLSSGEGMSECMFVQVRPLLGRPLEQAKLLWAVTTLLAKERKCPIDGKLVARVVQDYQEGRLARYAALGKALIEGKNRWNTVHVPYYGLGPVAMGQAPEID